MKNCLIIGSARSGTSMLAGTLSKSGYFMGKTFQPPNEHNPKGFFEAREVIAINEALLSQVMPKRPWILGRWYFKDRPLYGQAWLARVPVGTTLQMTEDITENIRAATQKEPYCYKDPRFSYTLNAWRNHLRNVAYVCIFRDPATTANSMLTLWKNSKWLSNSVRVTFNHTLEVWDLNYRHVLDAYRPDGSWLFLHYNQVLTDQGLDRLGKFLGAQIDGSFPDAAISRSVPNQPVPEPTRQTYTQLCELAGYQDHNDKFNLRDPSSLKDAKAPAQAGRSS